MDLDEASKKMLAMMLALAKKELLDKVIKGVKGCTPILAYLEDNKEKDILIGDIASFYNLSTARIAVAIDVLAKKELVKKYKPIEDKRKTIVRITKEGEEFLSKTFKEVESVFVSLLKKLSDDEQAEYIRLSEKMVS